MRTVRRRTAALVAAIAVAAGLGGCRWRDGRVVWIDRHDAAPDGDPDRADAEAEADQPDACASEAVGTLSAPELFALILGEEPGLLVLDVRSEALCRASRVPGALCAPFRDGGFESAVDGLAEARRLVVYDQGLGEALAAAEALELACDQLVQVLEDGLQGWLEADYPIEP